MPFLQELEFHLEALEQSSGRLEGLLEAQLKLGSAPLPSPVELGTSIRLRDLAAALQDIYSNLQELADLDTSGSSRESKY